MSEVKTAAYLCSGCGLGAAFDFDRLEKVARREGKLAQVHRHELLCGDDGVQHIRADIAAEGLTHVLLAACSRRAKTDAFAFDEVALVRTNLREGVLWAVADGDEHADARQEMADDYLRMGCAELKKMKRPLGKPVDGPSRRVLVVGGGVTGLTAAIEAAEAGVDVLLVERQPQLGGFVAHLAARAPWREPYDAPQATGLPQLIARVRAHPRIELVLGATVERTTGAPGRFELRLALADGSRRDERVGAIVQASGFTLYPLAKLPELGGGLPQVVDQAGFEALARAAAAARADPADPVDSAGAAAAAPIRRADGAALRCVVFVQCAGQRDPTGTHLPYCSGHCCATSVKQALMLKAADPAVDAVLLYDDLRLPGMGEDFYRAAQAAGVTFTKARVGGVEASARGARVHLRDLILDADASIDADLVVLATGQVPNAGIGADAAAAEPGASVLNLAYRQGPDLPQLRHGLADSHFICFPYETRRTGIYAAGPVRRPMDIAQAVDDAAGAALKAIQAIEHAAAGCAAHPRSGDLSYPIVRLEGCTQCKRCTVECPFGAIDEDAKGYPVFNESRCRRCGTCMGACPVRVIAFENYSVDTVGAQLKAIDMPDEFSGKARILVLACESDAYPALDMAGFARHAYSACVRVVPVRCLGSVNTIWITDALNGGWDGMLLLGCRKGDDYQCHFVKGSELADERMRKVDDTLQQLGLEPERVRSVEVAITDSRRVAELIDAYVAEIEGIGLSPMKGFA